MKYSVQQLRRAYAKTYRALGRAELQRGMDESLDLELHQLFLPHLDSELWLDFYTKDGLRLGLEEYGFLEECNKRGYHDVVISFSHNEIGEHMLRLLSVDPAFDEPLVEMVVRKSYLHTPPHLRAHLQEPDLLMLNIEWLQLQHPLSSFRPDRLPLPGQKLRGLGLSPHVAELVRNSCKRLSLGGAVSIPSYFHNAIAYSKRFYYVDPVMQGRLEALQRDLFAQLHAAFPSWETPLLLAASSWAITWKLVRSSGPSHDEVFEWEHTGMVSPVHQSWRHYFNSPWYHDQTKQAANASTYTLLLDMLTTHLEHEGLYPFDRAKIERWLGKNLDRS